MHVILVAYVLNAVRAVALDTIFQIIITFAIDLLFGRRWNAQMVGVQMENINHLSPIFTYI